MASARKIFCVVLLGGPGVGKTQSCMTLTADKNSETVEPTPTVGFEMFSIHNYNFSNPMTINIFDMGGFQLKPDSMKMRLKFAHSVIFMYDASNRKSFEDLNFYLDRAKEFSSGKWIGELIANSTEAEKKEVSSVEGQQFAKKFNLNFREISAKDRKNLAEFYSNLFEKLGKLDKKDLNMSLTLQETKESNMDIEKEKKKSDCNVF